ncbi:hypothetical protein AAF712_013035 [Marasmius tenuissimus]|uniref:SAM domain-containing protein n=1 Tax=Marasmius tenuissimus TaxID=585030 RepID=A0ABR2ZFT6_9AGAR
MQSFTFPVPISSSTPSTPNRRSASPDKDKHQRNSSQDIQRKSNPEQLRPNPHPYAIKTTSTALLSRSNSASSKHTKHHYIPSTPPSRHRTTSSASNIEIPRPLPIPPPSPSDSEGGEGNPHTGPPPSHQPRRLKRSETTTGTPPAPSPIAAPLTLEELPPNPKQWTPSQLSIYLATALRISGPGELPAPVANDIARFVRERKITGRVFLRLSEEELEAYGMNKLWRTALLSASRTLRQNVLKGRIWGIPDDENNNSNDSPSPSPQPSNEDETTPNNRKSVFIQRQRPVYSSAESNSSIEDLQLPLLPTSISDGTGSARFKSISKGSTRSKGGRTSRFLASSGFFDAPETGADVGAS